MSYSCSIGIAIGGKTAALKNFVNQVSKKSYYRETYLFKHFQVKEIKSNFLIYFLHDEINWRSEFTDILNDLYNLACSMKLSYTHIIVGEDYSDVETLSNWNQPFFDDRTDVFSVHRTVEMNI